VEPGYWLLFCLFVGCMIVRSVYEWLKARGRINPANRPIFALIALDMTVLWLCWFGMGGFDPIDLNLPVAVKWIGLGATILGTCLAVGALLQLRGVENIEHLRTGGLFALMRHPMYTGFMLWFFGWALYHDAAASLGAGLFGIANVFYWQRVEEDALVKRFGQTYLDYRKRTRY
jgi:protein-S-isoprenylcysteine O-methyltransferase Ste14